MGFEVKPCWVCRGFVVPLFDIFYKYFCIEYDYFSNADELSVCFGCSLGFGYCGVIADDVEGIDDRITVYSDVVDCLTAEFITASFGDLSVDAE